MNNDTVQDWSAILDDDEYTWDAPWGRDPEADVKAIELGYRMAQADLEADRGMVLVGYLVTSLCAALVGAGGMWLALWMWG